MPYIDEDDRGHAVKSPVTPGELNFAITTLVISFIKKEGLSYGAINDALGALEGAKQEFYRRVAVPYEDKKRSINGDVYPEAWV